MYPTISDEEVLKRLQKAHDSLGSAVEDGQTTAGNTALRAAQRTLIQLTVAFEMSIEERKGDP